MKIEISGKLLILQSGSVITSLQHALVLQRLSKDCGTLRADQLYNLAHTVEIDEFPWIASLKDKAKRHHQCISVLITDRHLLTATDCFNDNLNPDLYFIELGNCKFHDRCVVRKDLKRIERSGYQTKMVDELSMLRLKEPVIVTDTVRPIYLPGEDDRRQYAASYLTFTGWQYPSLRSAKFPVIIYDLQCCLQYPGYQSYEATGVLCASTCDNGWNYDSSSILLDINVKNALPEHYFLVGLLTDGNRGCTDTTPDIFQPIARYRSWILETIAYIEEQTLNHTLLFV